MAASALIVKVPEAEALVRPLRDRFDATAQLGVPAHITILFPFLPPDNITPAVLGRLALALHSVSAFSYSLASIGRFEATTYLVPAPSEPFISLTASVVRHFPDMLPYGGLHAGVVPHLTVAHGDAGEAADAAKQLEAQLRAHSAVLAECGAVTLLENTSGRWKEMHAFELPR